MTKKLTIAMIQALKRSTENSGPVSRYQGHDTISPQTIAGLERRGLVEFHFEPEEIGYFIDEFEITNAGRKVLADIST